MSSTEKPRLFIQREDRELYKNIAKREAIFKTDNEHQYLYALSLGFRNDIPKPITSKDGFAFENYFDESERSLFKAIALYKTKNLGILANKQELLKIADEYAHSGIHILDQKTSSQQFGTYIKQEEVEVKEIYKEYKVKIQQ